MTQTGHVQDLKSLENVDKGSMHVVEHHDDFFSWEKNTQRSQVNSGKKGQFIFSSLGWKWIACII
jgi:hypothetical protein